MVFLGSPLTSIPEGQNDPFTILYLKNQVFKKYLDLKNVKEGIYFIAAFPLLLGEASESPVVPVLSTKEELADHISNP